MVGGWWVRGGWWVVVVLLWAAGFACMYSPMDNYCAVAPASSAAIIGSRRESNTQA